MGFLADPVGSISDTVSHVGKVVSESPIAQAVITVGGAMMGVPPQITAGLLGVNQTAQTGDLAAGLTTGGLSYLGGTGINNYAATGSLFGTPTAAAGSTGPLSGAAWNNAATATGAGLEGAASDAAFNSALANSGSSTGLGSLWGNFSGANLVGTGLNLAGGYLQGKSASDAATTNAQAQIRAAQIAADAAKFKPVGVTTNFGASRFGYDANGNLVSAGYALNPLLQGQQNQLLSASGGLLNQFTGAQSATAPMSEAAQRAMQLGQGYLATSPAEQAQKYMAEQQALLATGRERDLSGLMTKLQAQGRMGLATGATTTGMGAANPALEAYYNAQRQQDLGLAAQATQGGMDYAKFGVGMVGTGGDLLSSMYRTQTGAFDPYKTALGGAQTIEGLGQNALTLGMDLGKTSSTASGNAGQLLASGMTNAANTMAPANAWSPWGNLLTGAGGAMQQYRFDPMTGKAL